MGFSDFDQLMNKIIDQNERKMYLRANTDLAQSALSAGASMYG